MTDSMSTSDRERFVAFKLPIRSHNMLLKKIYTRYHEENNHTNQFAQKQKHPHINEMQFGVSYDEIPSVYSIIVSRTME